MKHLSHILCPVDFSDASYEAIRRASFLARLFQADLTLLHVVQIPVSYGVDYGIDPQSTKLVERASGQARTLLRQAKKAYIPYAVKCKSSIRYGNTSHEIEEEAKRLNSDFIVMAMDNSPNSEKVYQEIVNRVSCPVLYLPCSKNALGKSSYMGFKKILIPLNLDAHIPIDTTGLLRYIRDYFSAMGPELLILCVIEPGASQEVVQKRKVEIEAYADDFLDSGASKVTVQLFQGEYPDQEITRIATAESCDIIMMYTHVLHDERDEPGPVTHGVIQSAETAVLTLRNEG